MEVSGLDSKLLLASTHIFSAQVTENNVYNQKRNIYSLHFKYYIITNVSSSRLIHLVEKAQLFSVIV